jgi:hypothetical protein
MYVGWASIRLSLQNAVGLFLSLITVAGVSGNTTGLPASVSKSPLSASQVVDNLVRKDQERAQALRHYESTRIYRLTYHGFPGDRVAEMVVEATYDHPSKKQFKIVSQTGSKLIIDRVFKRLLDSEKEAAEPEVHARTLLNRDNYEIALTGYEQSPTGGQYELTVDPKSKSKYLYRGKVWIDGTDFAVTRIDAEPAQNPSFWTKKSEIHHEYMKVGDFWLPRRNESISYIRLGGRATLTIDYKNYRIRSARLTGNSEKTTAETAR